MDARLPGESAEVKDAAFTMPAAVNEGLPITLTPKLTDVAPAGITTKSGAEAAPVCLLRFMVMGATAGFSMAIVAGAERPSTTPTAGNVETNRLRLSVVSATARPDVAWS